METHDPQKIIEGFRNSLAAHDRPIYFLFGAGTSCSVNIAPEPEPGKKRSYTPLIPPIEPLTEFCKSDVVKAGGKYEKAWGLMEKHCNENVLHKNIENILSLVRAKITAISSDEKLLGLTKEELNNLESYIQKCIAKKVAPPEESIPEDLPHNKFSSWMKEATRLQPVEIFTTNYDMLIERSLEFEQIPFFDGFVGSSSPFFYGNCLDDESFMPSNKWAKLWKIHGSVNWSIKKVDSRDVVVRGEITESGEMILPSHRKYDESKKQPYTAMLDRLARVLNKDHSLLITCGYSFGDQHINSVIFSALENRPTAHVISLQYDEIDKAQDIARWSSKRTNLSVFAPNAAVIGGKFGKWKLLRPVDEKTCSFMDIAFDSRASVDDANESLKGDFKLGDFNWFCSFLLTLERKVKNEPS